MHKFKFRIMNRREVNNYSCVNLFFFENKIINLSYYENGEHTGVMFFNNNCVIRNVTNNL